MIPHGFWTAWLNCANVSFRPARSGPKTPCALFAWQFLHEVVLPSQSAFPATGSPAGAALCAEATAANRGSIKNANNSFFMCPFLSGRHRGRPGEPGCIQGHVRLHVGEFHVHLHERLTERAVERNLHAGDITEIRVVNLSGDKTDRGQRPAHQAHQQSRRCEIQVRYRLPVVIYALYDGHFLIVENGAADAPVRIRLLDRGGKSDERLETRAIEIAGPQRHDRHPRVPAPPPAPRPPARAPAVAPRQLG